jgi:AraC-like DNA-binding protein
MLVKMRTVIFLRLNASFITIYQVNIDKLIAEIDMDGKVLTMARKSLLLFEKYNANFMFTYAEYAVDQRLSYFIKKLWILDNLTNDTPITGKSVLPNGCFNIAVIEGNGLLINHQGQELHLTQGTYFCGQMTEAIGVTILNGAKATMIQLYAWVPVHFSAVAMDQFRDRIVPFELTGIDSEVIRQLPGKSNQVICKNIFYVFEPKLITSASSKAIYLSTKTLMDNNGNYAIEKLAADLNCSSRYLQKSFKKHVGLSPKQFAVILKLRSAVDGIAYPEKTESSLTSLAIENHFYDQAHFNNTFKSIVKTSPKSFHIPDYFLSFKQ